MKRRSFLRRTGSIVGTVGACGRAVATDSRAFAGVTTRGHFTVDWAAQTHLEDEYGKYEYDTFGTIPGYHTESSPEELCVYVHGWLMDKPKVRKRFPKQRRAIRRAGFDGPVVVFSWGSGSPVTGWWIAAEYARRNAHKLGQFLREYRSANPDTTIRVIGFSLGAMVTVPAGQSLADREWSGTVDSLSLIGAAIDDESLAANGTYADCADVFGEIDNFYKTDDQVLDKLYPAAEFDGALGTEGLDGEPPANYEQHQVDYVAHHDAYWRYENGCIPAVVEEWRDE